MGEDLAEVALDRLGGDTLLIAVPQLLFGSRRQVPGADDRSDWTLLGGRSAGALKLAVSLNRAAW